MTPDKKWIITQLNNLGNALDGAFNAEWEIRDQLKDVDDKELQEAIHQVGVNLAHLDFSVNRLLEILKKKNIT